MEFEPTLLLGRDFVHSRKYMKAFFWCFLTLVYIGFVILAFRVPEDSQPQASASAHTKREERLPYDPRDFLRGVIDHEGNRKRGFFDAGPLA